VNLHFISGLPRSGSTLLAALLRQNPRFSASIESPVHRLFKSMLADTSAKYETSVFIDDATRERLLRGLFDAYYANAPEVVFDTHRGWTTELATLARLYPRARVICCVRNPAWILDSIERLVRRNPEPSQIFSFDPWGTVYNRVTGLASNTGLYGFAVNGLREAAFSEQAEKVLIVRYEGLVENPKRALKEIYEFIGEPLFEHDPKRVEPIPGCEEFDRRVGAPGLHDLRSRVEPRARKTILPPDLFNRFASDGFWEKPGTPARVV
jgi:sulfotransferase